MMQNVITNVRDIVEAPLTEPLDLEHLFLLIGGIIIFWGMWMLILSHLGQVLRVE